MAKTIKIEVNPWVLAGVGLAVVGTGVILYRNSKSRAPPPSESGRAPLSSGLKPVDNKRLADIGYDVTNLQVIRNFQTDWNRVSAWMQSQNYLPLLDGLELPENNEMTLKTREALGAATARGIPPKHPWPGIGGMTWFEIVDRMEGETAPPPLAGPS